MKRSEKQSSIMLREFEKRNDLLRYKVDGLSYWIFLRIKIQRELQNIRFSRQNKLFFFKLILLIRDYIKLLFLDNAEILVKTASSHLTEKFGDKYKDLFFDDLIDIFDNQCIKLIEVNNAKLYQERWRSEYRRNTLTTLVLNISASFLSKFIRNKQIINTTNHFANAISKDLKLFHLNKKWIKNQLIFFHAKRLCYRELLKLSKVKIVITNNIFDFALFAATMDLGIKCYGIQHGLLNEYHPQSLYDYMTPYRNSLIKPGKLLVFGQYWKDKLKTNNFYFNDEIVIIGDPRVEKLRELFFISKRYQQSENAIRILFTTQGIHANKFCDFFEEAKKLFQHEGIKYSLIIKTHPLYNADQNIYKDFFSSDSNVQVVDDSSTNFKSRLYRNTDIHISIYSACLFETLGLGIPTCILGFDGYENNIDLITNDHVLFIKTPHDLLKIISYFDIISKNKDNRYQDYFYASGSSDRFLEFIKESMKST